MMHDRLSPEDIKILLKDKDSRYRHYALGQITLENGPNLLPFLMELLKCPDSVLREKTAKTITSLFPFSIMESFAPDNGCHENINPSHICYEDSTELWASLEGVLISVREQGPDVIKSLLSGLILFPGITDGIGKLIEEKLGGEWPGFFRLKESERQKELYPRQVMIALTYNCNISCPYCYAAELKQEFPEAISREDFLTVLRMIESGNFERVSFTGGEPTTYPDFPAIIQMIKERGLRTYFASNTLFDEKVLNALDPEVVIHIASHINEPPTYSGKQWKTLQRNLLGMKEKNIRVDFRYNIYSPDLNEWDFLFEACREYGIRLINFALTIPNTNWTNAYISQDDLKQMKETVMGFIRRCVREGIGPKLAKPVPPCIFDREEIRFLVLHDVFKTICTVDRNNYMHNLIINPDLTTFPCIGLHHKGPSLASLDSINNAGIYYRDILQQLQKEKFYEFCGGCSLYHGQKCVGGCLSYKFNVRNDKRHCEK